MPFRKSLLNNCAGFFEVKTFRFATLVRFDSLAEFRTEFFGSNFLGRGIQAVQQLKDQVGPLPNPRELLFGVYSRLSLWLSAAYVAVKTDTSNLQAVISNSTTVRAKSRSVQLA